MKRAKKTVAQSKIVLSSLMRPQHANFAGNVHGGSVLALIDEAAYTCASKYSGSYCVTVAVDQVEFLSPVRVGDVLALKAAVNRVGRSSMEIGIQIQAEDPRDPGSERRTHRSFVTMVAVDDERSPVEVPELVLETEEDRKWACEAELRRELRRKFQSSVDAGACRL